MNFLVGLVSAVATTLVKEADDMIKTEELKETTTTVTEEEVESDLFDADEEPIAKFYSNFNILDGIIEPNYSLSTSPVSSAGSKNKKVVVEEGSNKIENQEAPVEIEVEAKKDWCRLNDVFQISFFGRKISVSLAPSNF